MVQALFRSRQVFIMYAHKTIRYHQSVIPVTSAEKLAASLFLAFVRLSKGF